EGVGGGGGLEACLHEGGQVGRERVRLLRQLALQRREARELVLRLRYRQGRLVPLLLQGPASLGDAKLRFTPHDGQHACGRSQRGVDDDLRPFGGELCPQVRVLTLQALELVGDLDPVVVLPPSRRPYERRHNATLRPNRTFRRSHPFSKNFEKSAAVDSRRRGERLLDRRPRGGL